VAVSNEPGTADCQVIFQPLGRRVTIKSGTTILEAGRRAGLLLSAACGGVGLCGRCRVEVSQGEMYPSEGDELAFLSEGSFPAGTRLACEARIASSIVVEVPPDLALSGQRLQLESEGEISVCDPLIASHQIHFTPPTLQDSRSDYTRVAELLANASGRDEWMMHPRVAAQLSPLVNEGVCELTAYSRSNEVIGFARASRAALGLAIDLGCTKIAAYLVDLHTGSQLAAEGGANPQIPYGEDLISRLVYAASSEQQAERLSEVVCESVTGIAARLCDTSGAHLQQICDVCVVGNTAMTHLLLRLPVMQLLHAPFVASIDRDLDFDANELGWSFAPRARVHVLPSIGGFVGADHVAMILSRGIDKADRVTVGLDIGTNTEIVLRDPQKDVFITTSVPSGPVFEGGHVSNGIRAASGAVDRCFVIDGELRYGTIDDAKPIGICGSGVVALIAECLRIGVIGERGQLSKTDKRVRKGACGPELLVVPATDTGHGRDLVLTQQDINQVQLGKAAIYAGIETLLAIAGVAADEVEVMVVAGAFGSYLDLRSAVSIGMLPRFAHAEYQQVGNAAGAGAKMALVSDLERQRAREIAKRAKKIELKQHEDFDRFMARATRFPCQ
jgi:uncharacterized 2Fe-2S/4Fe-4S cluster protein (DUF4445 family)